MLHKPVEGRHHPRSSIRKLERHTITIDNRPVGGYALLCSTSGCGQRGEVLDRNTGALPPHIVLRKFEQKGWTVGHDSRGDLCPSCTATKILERRAKRFKSVPKLVPDVKPVETSEAIETTETEMPTNGAEPPAGMTRMDRRIIHAKLEEVYESEEAGYKPGWTDLAVAKNLGEHIPVAWIALVREEAFGPAKDNEEIRDMLKRVADAAHAANVVLAECKSYRKEASELIERSNALMAKATEIGKTLNGLITIADRIEKAVTP